MKYMDKLGKLRELASKAEEYAIYRLYESIPFIEDRDQAVIKFREFRSEYVEKNGGVYK